MKIKFAPENKKIVLYFYIYAFKRASAGVVTLYKIVDILNRMGIPSYVLAEPNSVAQFHYSRFFSSQNYITPALNLMELDRHIASNYKPIVIYTDSSELNPLKAKNIIRMLFYFDGKFTGKRMASNKNNGLVYFSDAIFNAISGPKKFLFTSKISFPIADPKNFYSGKKSNKKVYYYGCKFDFAFNKKFPREIMENATRIVRDNDNFNFDLYRDVLANASLLHVFEDTAVIYEALLSGCPVNIHPAGFFPNGGLPLATKELGKYGLIFKLNPTNKDIEKARNEIPLFKKRYKSWVNSGLKEIALLSHNLDKFSHDFNDDLIKELVSNIITTNSLYLHAAKNNLGNYIDSKIFLNNIIGPHLINMYPDNKKFNHKKFHPLYFYFKRYFGRTPIFSLVKYIFNTLPIPIKLSIRKLFF
jgi:hypothetical protein